MNILILTDPFGPPAYAPRMRNLAANLKKDGHDVTVITEKMYNTSFQTEDFTLLQMPYYTDNHGFRYNVQWFLDKLFHRKEKHFYRFVQQQVNITYFDWILCSTFSDFPLWTTIRLHTRYHIPFAVDLRDIIEQWGSTSYTSGNRFLQRILRKPYEHKAIRLRNRALHLAQFVTTVSPWHVNTIRPYNANTHLIYNGFDPKLFSPTDKTSNQFILSYLGRIYDFRLRDPRPLFSALHSLLTEYPDIKKHLLLKFYIEPQCIRVITDAIQKEQLLDNSAINTFIPSSETVQQMQQSSICILLTNYANENGPFGIMTSKFFEILGMEKPVLCIPSDKGCLADAIQYTHAGLASDNIDEIKNFILDKYQEWKQNGFTHQPVRNIEQFNRENQAKQFEKLFLQTCDSRVLLTDICWTLYHSNTTFDFLDTIIQDKGYQRLRRWMQRPLIRWMNLLFLKLFHFDYLRHKALRYLRIYSQEEINQMAETFVNTYLEQRKIAAAWQVLEGRQVVIVSGTIAPIAQAVAKRIGAQQVLANDIFKQKAYELSNYDILTDNTTDLPFVQRAHTATIITYNNQHWWEKQKNMPPCIFITNDQKRY